MDQIIEIISHVRTYFWATILQRNHGPRYKKFSYEFQIYSSGHIFVKIYIFLQADVKKTRTNFS